ncbi:MAG TPA: TIGR03557 family F420-dependent LLM class oxidoreductase [Actinomycetota bacterium]|nr:TIGR03557 family F420-dependent LLM class oxidoreductase [Actinomycetota bacterium]
MTAFGYHLSAEEHPPDVLVRNAVRAEEAGFDFVTVSDHFHPWVPWQGESPFVWSVVGALAHATERVSVVTAVTCPTMRIHPAIVAQAAATSACMLPGRFVLGLGSGENLNEHVLGLRWPSPPERLEMLEEAIEVIRSLWEGGTKSHRGRHYTVENARIYTLPERSPPIAVAAAGKVSARLAGRLGDALVGVSSSSATVDVFREAGGAGKPAYGKLDVCVAPTAEEAVRTAHRWWPNSRFPGQTAVDVALPEHFAGLAEMVTPDMVTEAVVCGPDPDRIADRVREYRDGGYDHVVLHQVGPDQDAFFRAWEDGLRSAVSRAAG